MNKDIKEAFKGKSTLKNAITIVKAMGGITLLAVFGTALVKLVVFIWNVGA